MLELYREPEDYNEGAGTKFQCGEIIITTDGSFTGVKAGSIGIVIHQPGLLTQENAKHWENIYNVEFGDNDYIYHSHVHESDMRLCSGVQDGFLIEHSKLLKSNSQLSHMEWLNFLHSQDKKYEGE